MINTDYGFSSDPSEDDEARKAKATDYAKIQGAWAETDAKDKNYGYSLWLLRTAFSESRYVDYVFESGACWAFSMAEYIEKGTRPAIKLSDMSLHIKWNVHGQELVQIYSQGEKIVPPPTPEMQGYVSTWNAEIPEFMPSESLEFTASWAARTDTKYTVKTFTMNADGSYTEKAEVLEGMTGALARAKYDVPENFVFNSAKSVLSGMIKADNSLVLKVYLDRKRYSLTTVIGSESKKVSYYHGADIPEQATPQKDGYKFICWSPYMPKIMPAEDLTVTAVFQKLYSGVKITVATPEKRYIEYGETVTLHAYVTEMPVNAKIKWRIAEGNGVSLEPSHSGKLCHVTSVSDGNCIIEAYVADEYGNAIYDENGVRVCDREGISSEVNLWMIIVRFFRNLFRIV
ncbi:MAG: InlB B-repeat-containing protein [Clostridia bacterium]|nr:InlB B-repeat-containing protein [Clostridia bacterium]